MLVRRAAPLPSSPFVWVWRWRSDGDEAVDVAGPLFEITKAVVEQILEEQF
jgi:hypothetical protein